MNSGECLKTIHTNLEWIYCTKAISSNKIISGSGFNAINIWDLSTDKCLKTIESICVKHIIDLLDERIVSCSKYGKIQITNIKSGKLLKTINVIADKITAMARLSTNTIIICCQDNTIKILNLDTGKCLKSFEQQYAICIEVFQTNLYNQNLF